MKGLLFEHSAHNGLLDSSYVREIGYGAYVAKVALESITTKEKSTLTRP